MCAKNVHVYCAPNGIGPCGVAHALQATSLTMVRDYMEKGRGGGSEGVCVVIGVKHDRSIDTVPE